ncbi:hypothetical protein HYDPIDRAFT_62090, partial [Hydnomerulius pinastri MD-312]
GHDDWISGIVYLPEGDRVVTCSWDKTVRLWDATTGEEEGERMEHGAGVRCLAVTKDGKRIVSGDYDGELKVWEVETRKLVEMWEGHEGRINSVTISPDGEFAASGDSRGRIVIREAKSGGEIRDSIETGDCVYSLCFSPSGETIVYLFSGSSDCTICKWDSDTGGAVGEPWQEHTSLINSLALSPDGTHISSASDDQTICFWHTDSGSRVGEPLEHQGKVRALAFSPSGEFIAGGGEDYTLSIW